MKDPNIAYEILALGMHTGKLFANQHRLGDYFTDTQTDYFHARNMVNPGADKANEQEVADIAVRFEKGLRASQPGQPKVASR